MSVRSLMNQPLVVSPVGGTATDVYGNWVASDLGSFAEQGYLEQKDTIEYLDDRQTVVSRWTAYLRPESAVTALAHISFNSQTFQVDGEPWHVYNPRTKAVDHIECKLTAVT